MKPGETYFTPAHTVHAIGAGIVLCEIQQNSDVTYRLWDYGRPRPIHVEKAVPIADLGVHPGAARPVRVDDHREELVRDRHFITELVRLGSGAAEMPEAALMPTLDRHRGQREYRCRSLSPWRRLAAAGRWGSAGS